MKSYKSITELTKAYGIKSCYIRQAIQKGELDFYRFAEKTMFLNVRDFERWIETKKNKPSKEIPLLRMKNLVEV